MFQIYDTLGRHPRKDGEVGEQPKKADMSSSFFANDEEGRNAVPKEGGEEDSGM